MHGNRPAFALVCLLALSCTDPVQPSSGTTFAVGAASVMAEAECLGCVLDSTLSRRIGAPATHTFTFTGDPEADYIIDIDDLASQGADGSVVLNGEVLLAPRTSADVGPRHVRRAVTIAVDNALLVRLTGKPGSTLSVRLIGGSKIVGREGGTVTAPGGVSISVPAGALANSSPLQVLLDSSETVGSALDSVR